jgi:hypothetical protein
MLLDAGIPIELLQSKGFLTDEGKAIHSAVQEFGCIRFSCYRHLIEKMGSNSLLGIITRRLLFLSTPVTYEPKLQESIIEIQELLTNERITLKQVQKFCKIFDLAVNDDGEILITTFDHHNALWVRADHGIATCSNHLERLHRTLNDAVSGLNLFTRRFSVVIKIILDWPIGFSHNQQRQEKLLIKTLRKRAKQNGIEQSDQCTSLNCGWSKFYSKLFGIENFPCVHTIQFKSPQFLEIPFPDFTFEKNKVLIIQEQTPPIGSTQRNRRRQRQLNDGEEIGNDSQNNVAFLLETTAELMQRNPTIFRDKCATLIYVTEFWVFSTDGQIIIEPNANKEEINMETKTQFWVDLMTEAGGSN